MIFIRRYTNIYLHQQLLIEFLRSDQNLNLERLLRTKQQVIEVKFSKGEPVEEFQQFLYEFTTRLKEEFTLNRLYVEDQALAKKHTRSRIGLFFHQRKDSLVGNKILFEKEVDVEENRSYFMGAIATEGLLTEQFGELLPQRPYNIAFGSRRAETSKYSDQQIEFLKRAKAFEVNGDRVILDKHRLVTNLALGAGYVYWTMYNGADEGVFTLVAGEQVRSAIDGYIRKSLGGVTGLSEIIEERVSEEGYTTVVQNYLQVGEPLLQVREGK